MPYKSSYTLEVKDPRDARAAPAEGSQGGKAGGGGNRGGRVVARPACREGKKDGGGGATPRRPSQRASLLGMGAEGLGQGRGWGCVWGE